MVSKEEVKTNVLDVAGSILRQVEDGLITKEDAFNAITSLVTNAHELLEKICYDRDV